MKGFNETIKTGSHSSSGSDKHPYLKEGNEASKTFEIIAAKRKAIKANGGKSTGLEL